MGTVTERREIRQALQEHMGEPGIRKFLACSSEWSVWVCNYCDEDFITHGRLLAVRGRGFCSARCRVANHRRRKKSAQLVRLATFNGSMPGVQ